MVVYRGIHRRDEGESAYSLYRKVDGIELRVGTFGDFSRLILSFENSLASDYEHGSRVKVISGNQHGAFGLPIYDLRALKARATTHNKFVREKK